MLDFSDWPGLCSMGHTSLRAACGIQCVACSVYVCAYVCVCVQELLNLQLKQDIFNDFPLRIAPFIWQQLDSLLKTQTQLEPNQQKLYMYMYLYIKLLSLFHHIFQAKLEQLFAYELSRIIQSIHKRNKIFILWLSIAKTHMSLGVPITRISNPICISRHLLVFVFSSSAFEYLSFSFINYQDMFKHLKTISVRFLNSPRDIHRWK